MEIKLNVEISASKELSAILEKLVGCFQVPEIAIQPVIKGVVKEAKAETPEAEVKPVEETQPAPEAKEAKPKKVTEVDVRAAIDACRKRFCGDDYKNNADTPEYKKYNKPLLAWFKEQAGILGAEDSKPSNLPAESREKFIEICESTILDDNDNFICKCPF